MGKRKIILLILSILFISFVPVVALNKLSIGSENKNKDVKTETPQNDRQYIVKVGDTAPDFEMQLPDGEKVKLSSQRGKIVMLQFTASWCSVCRKEMPFIEKNIWQKHKNNPKFTLYGVDRDEPAKIVKKFVAQTAVTYPIGLDPNADIFGLYALKQAGITRNVIIDENGKIVKLTRLYDENEFSEMVALIDKLLTEISNK